MGITGRALRSVSGWVGESYLEFLVLVWSPVEQKFSDKVVGRDMEPRERGRSCLLF